MLDQDFKDRVLADMAVNAEFRDKVTTALGSIQTRFAAEDALKAYKAEKHKGLYAVIGTLIAIAGVALPFFLK